eukprot:scaffold4248_cov231-Pinguiococcus_pyrenoidosus.AAC.4
MQTLVQITLRPPLVQQAEAARTVLPRIQPKNCRRLLRPTQLCLHRSSFPQLRARRQRRPDHIGLALVVSNDGEKSDEAIRVVFRSILRSKDDLPAAQRVDARGAEDIRKAALAQSLVQLDLKVGKEVRKVLLARIANAAEPLPRKLEKILHARVPLLRRLQVHLDLGLLRWEAFDSAEVLALLLQRIREATH